MTPKDKAEKLVSKFHRLDPDTDYYNGITVELAKQCAIIAVDEINNNVLVGIDLVSTWGNYWEKVKKEIKRFN